MQTNMWIDRKVIDRLKQMDRWIDRQTVKRIG